MADPIGYVILEQRSHDSPWSEVDRKPYYGGDITGYGLDLSKLTEFIYRFRLEMTEGDGITRTIVFHSIATPPLSEKGNT